LPSEKWGSGASGASLGRHQSATGSSAGGDGLLKDLRLAQEAVRASAAAAALGAHAEAIYAALAKAGEGNADFSAVIRAIHARSAQ
jgi:3-hydroxyisobutyrate dehydrogenase-like beta-hydroxyacid dehydrogenase